MYFQERSNKVAIGNDQIALYVDADWFKERYPEYEPVEGQNRLYRPNEKHVLINENYEESTEGCEMPYPFGDRVIAEVEATQQAWLEYLGVPAQEAPTYKWDEIASALAYTALFIRVDAARYTETLPPGAWAAYDTCVNSVAAWNGLKDEIRVGLLHKNMLILLESLRNGGVAASDAELSEAIDTYTNYQLTQIADSIRPYINAEPATETAT